MATPLSNLPTDHAVLAEHVALAGKRAVDVGAGAGGLVRSLSEQGAEPIGVECGPAMIAQALDNDMPATMTERDEVRYRTSYSYSDVAELEKEMVGIDPERQAAFDAVKDEVFELFHTNAVEHDGAYWFAQPVVMRLFTKV